MYQIYLQIDLPKKIKKISQSWKYNVRGNVSSGFSVKKFDVKIIYLFVYLFIISLLNYY